MAVFPPPLIETAPPAPVAAPSEDTELLVLLRHDFAVAEEERNWSVAINDQTPRLAVPANPRRVLAEVVLVSGGVTIYRAGQECLSGWDPSASTPGIPLVGAGASYLCDHRYVGEIWLVAEGGFPIDVRVSERSGSFPWPLPRRRR